MRHALPFTMAMALSSCAGRDPADIIIYTVGPAAPEASPDTDANSGAGPAQDSAVPGAGDAAAGANNESSPYADNSLCVAGTSRCSGNSVQTCGSESHWASAVPCVQPTPDCYASACTCLRSECAAPGGGVVCSNEQIDSNNCGACGSSCGGATPFCYGGTCTSVPPSCQAGGDGISNCGASNESCCTSLEVPGGTFFRTYANLADGGAIDEADPATVSGFRLDKYLVTVGRFRQYVNYVTGISGAPPANGSGVHTHLNGGLGLVDSWSPGTYETGWDAENWNVFIATGPAAELTWETNLNESGWPYLTPPPATEENTPVGAVNWYEAYAFCIWDGGFLPSEAEWEYAAAGGSQQRQYPWGSTDPGMDYLYAIYGDDYPEPDAGTYGSLAPVGTATLGAAAWGQLDMAGETPEWALDWYATYVVPCTNCADLLPSSERVSWGTDYTGSASYLMSRGSWGPEEGQGFRCARTP